MFQIIYLNYLDNLNVFQKFTSKIKKSYKIITIISILVKTLLLKFI